MKNDYEKPYGTHIEWTCPEVKAGKVNEEAKKVAWVKRAAEAKNREVAYENEKAKKDA